MVLYILENILLAASLIGCVVLLNHMIDKLTDFINSVHSESVKRAAELERSEAAAAALDAEKDMRTAEIDIMDELPGMNISFPGQAACYSKRRRTRSGKGLVPGSTVR